MIEQNPGLTEEQLLELCSDENNHLSFKHAPYWPAEIYSFGKYIREYGYYSKFLPLAIYTDHGAGRVNNQPWKNEIENDAPYMFYHSPASVEIWKKFSKKPCYVIYSPFVYYRKTNNIEKTKNARGTIAFPTHSIAEVDELSNTEKYIEDLKALPEKFQPVSVCLYVADIKKGRYKLFMEKGIPVFTAGACYNEKYAENFYDIFKNFSYATSNLVGSPLYYCVEMGTPFFIYGDKPLFMNRSDANLPIGKYDIYEGDEYSQNLHKIFSTLDCNITEEKRKIVETDLGIYDGLSRLRMFVILHLALIKWIFSGAFRKRFFRWILKNNK